MLKFLAVLFALFLLPAQASEVTDPCEFAHARTLKIDQTSDAASQVHVMSHCKLLNLEDLTFLSKEEVTAVVQWEQKVKQVDLSGSVYRYYFQVLNDGGQNIRVGFPEWKVAHAHHFAMLGDLPVEIPPCTSFVMHFLSPGPPKIEPSVTQVKMPDKKGGWVVAGTQTLELYVSSSPYFARGKMTGYRFSKKMASSQDCQ